MQLCSCTKFYTNPGSSGVYIFQPEVLELVPPNQVYDIGSQLFPQLVADKLPFFAQNRFFNWIDIGRVSDYWSVLQRVLRGGVTCMWVCRHCGLDPQSMHPGMTNSLKAPRR